MTSPPARRKRSYGENLSDHWRGKTAISVITAGTTVSGTVTIARVVGGRDFGHVEPVPAEDGYALSLELMNYKNGELWLDGRATPQTDLVQNNSVFFDLRHQVEARLTDPFDFLQFHMPRGYFDAFARASGLPRIADLRFTSGKGIFDRTLYHIGQALLPAVDYPAEASQLFLDHMLTALCAHVTTTYGVRVEPKTTARGLSEWRMKRAKEMIESRLDGNLTMAEIATIARPYAEALFKAAGTDPVALSQQVQALAAVAAQPQLLQFADDPKVEPAQVAQVITSVIGAPLSPAASNLLDLVIQNGRLAALPEIATQFHALVNASSGVSDATVYSAFPIDAQALADVVAVLERRFQRKLNAQVVVDPELIGGIRVVVGDEVLDTSVKARLEQMRVALTA